MTDLHLSVKRVYWESIVDGLKDEEYRENTPYWAKRLVGKTYENLVIKLGYPKKEDTDRQLVFPYKGYTMKKKTISDIYGDKEIEVFAIKISR